jgi:hypothetical protein
VLIADTFSGLQQAKTADEAMNRSSLENSLNRLIQVQQFRQQRAKEDQDKQRNYEFMLQQHADQVAQQAWSNNRLTANDANNEQNMHIQWGREDDAALLKQRELDQRDREIRWGKNYTAARNAIGLGAVINLEQADVSPEQKRDLAAIQDRLKSDDAANVAAHAAVAARAQIPVDLARAARSSAVIETGKQAQALKDEAENFWSRRWAHPLVHGGVDKLPPPVTNIPPIDAAHAELIAGKLFDPSTMAVDPRTGNIVSTVKPLYPPTTSTDIGTPVTNGSVRLSPGVSKLQAQGLYAIDQISRSTLPEAEKAHRISIVRTGMAQESGETFRQDPRNDYGGGVSGLVNYDVGPSTEQPVHLPYYPSTNSVPAVPEPLNNGWQRNPGYQQQTDPNYRTPESTGVGSDRNDILYFLGKLKNSLQFPSY